VVAAVWVGFDDPRPIMGKATGGRLAAPVWARMMMRQSGGRGEWPRPPEIMEAWVDPSSGMLLAPGCRPWEGVARRELFIRGMAPVAVCPHQGQPEPLDLVADYDLPDYEEGMQTGLLPEDIPSPRPEDADADAEEKDEDDEDDEEGLRSYVPSSPRPGSPAPEEPVEPSAAPSPAERRAPRAPVASPRAEPTPPAAPAAEPTPRPSPETPEPEEETAPSPSPSPPGG
jgi:membrane peptidoglycan carboxypeptidase